VSARVIVIVDESVDPGTSVVGGVVVLKEASNEMLGWAVFAKPVRVHDASAARDLEERLDAADVEHRRWGVWANLRGSTG
jgi:hypothetical protein